MQMVTGQNIDSVFIANGLSHPNLEWRRAWVKIVMVQGTTLYEFKQIRRREL